MEKQNDDYIAQVHAAKRRKTITGIAVAAAVILLLFAIFGRQDGSAKEIDVERALSLAPALALTDEELALAETILDHDIFRNALNYDLVDSTTVFTWEETGAIVGSVVPEGADGIDISVIGAVAIVDYRLPQHRIILEYVDADRSGQVDAIRKSLAPMIDGVTTGCYALDHNLATGKTTCTYMKY